MATQLNISDKFSSLRIPTIVTWNRLEPRPRAEDFSRSLKAEVRDALWMLTRQWQLGEFQGEDAASPVFARIKIDCTRLTKYQDKSGTVSRFDISLPLETQVEQVPVGRTLFLRLQMGQYWFALLKKLGFARVQDYLTAYKAAYPIALPEEFQNPTQTYTDTPEAVEAVAHLLAHPPVHQLLRAAAGRGMDGGAFFDHLSGGGSADAGISVDSADTARIESAALAFQAWFARQYTQPASSNATSWVPSQLEYAFSCAAPISADGSQELVMIADQYHEGHLDWYSFDIDSSKTILGAAETPLEGTLESKILSFIPAPIDFAGMPNARWWQFEDQKTDFGDIDANTTDIAKLSLIEFGLIYGNDWFLIPFVLPVGSLAQVNGFEVTDNFGGRTWIEAAGAGAEDDWQRWNMYSLNQRGDTEKTDDRLFLPPAIGKLLQDDSLQMVTLVRDEMANMVWGVESIVPLETGVGRQGFRASLELRGYLKELLGLSGSSAPTSGATQTTASIQYQLGTDVPEDWIPFIPVKVKESDRQIRLQRGAMLRIFDDLDATPKIRPRTSVLREGLSTNSAYYIYEEEVPRAGAIATESFQRTRWHAGKTFVWLGRRKETGRGERSSGLKFDQIKNKSS